MGCRARDRTGFFFLMHIHGGGVEVGRLITHDTPWVLYERASGGRSIGIIPRAQHKAHLALLLTLIMTKADSLSGRNTNSQYHILFPMHTLHTLTFHVFVYHTEGPILTSGVGGEHQVPATFVGRQSCLRMEGGKERERGRQPKETTVPKIRLSIRVANY
ncbi:hypothetical protein LZ32DRAFT_10318 [Colletotrichum eremochloae]|nr:hypothetical protein LZ32DRAFT_10318 [Colletotrichum eremochloae]